MKAIFISPSGNRAVIKVVTIGHKHLVDLGWEHSPPSEEDMQAANAVIVELIGKATGAPTSLAKTDYFNENQREECERKAREFLGGGKG